jgi:hypothetical protein
VRADTGRQRLEGSRAYGVVQKRRGKGPTADGWYSAVSEGPRCCVSKETVAEASRKVVD